MQAGPITSLALKKPIFEDKACQNAKTTLGLKIEKQSGPWKPLPPDAGVLMASPPRNWAQTPEHPFPA
jgi:hypothetical protein